MKQSIKIIIVSLTLVVLLAISYVIYLVFFTDQNIESLTSDQQTADEITDSQTSDSNNSSIKKVSLDSAKENTHISQVAGTKGTYFMRGFEIRWNNIEISKGVFDWEQTDQMILFGGTSKDEQEIYPLPIVQPYANWDQDTCHEGAKYEIKREPKPGSGAGEVEKVGTPCDMDAYVAFLEKAVERYDGDGVDDMPGLTTPIKYWEIINEPSMQGGSTGGMGEELKFFVGTPDEYLDILKTSYEVIKKADPEAKVLHAGMAGMQSEAVDFFKPVFEKGGDYFDIANNHTISTDKRREDLSMIKFNELMAKHDLSDKPVWITEVQFGQLAEQPSDLKAFEQLMARATAFAFAKGADKLFFIENWTQWGLDNPFGGPPPGTDSETGKDKDAGSSSAMKGDDKREDFDKSKNGPTKEEMDEILNSSTHKAYLNLVHFLNEFDTVETIFEDYSMNPIEADGATSRVGQYKFIHGGDIVYVLWGNAEVPGEITGQVKVTDIYGDGTDMDASEIQVSDTPVFVEMKDI